MDGGDRKREVAFCTLLRDEPEATSVAPVGATEDASGSSSGVRKRSAGSTLSLKQRKGDPVQAELDSAMKRIGELTMQVELLPAKTETFGPLGRRRSRR